MNGVPNIDAQHLGPDPKMANIQADVEVRILGHKMNQILRAVASGPVHLDLLTAPDNNGLRRKIVATCGGRATYEGGTEVVTMTGGAEADVTTLPEGNVEAAHLEGDTITANLRASKLSIKQATISMTTEVETEEDE